MKKKLLVTEVNTKCDYEICYGGAIALSVKKTIITCTETGCYGWVGELPFDDDRIRPGDIVSVEIKKEQGE